MVVIRNNACNVAEKKSQVVLPYILETYRHSDTAWIQHLMLLFFGQGSSLLWTHMLKPFYCRPIALTQVERSQVDDVCECVRD